MQLRFLGAAQTVTGSKYLLTIKNKSILIDCGLFQGLKDLRLKNWDPFSVDPKSIDAILLTHAHIDHSGYIPRLIKEGFRGPVYCTEATLDLCRILLPDTGYLQEEDAEFLNRKKLSKHNPALPLFTKLEAEKSLEYFRPQPFDKEFEVVPGAKVRFLYSGHILGSAIVVVSVGDRKIAFSGDVGRQEDAILRPPVSIPEVDYLVVESTYGNRQHGQSNPEADLERVINDAVKRHGVVVIPAFTVGRAQTLMYHLSVLKRSGRIPNIPMYLNSPMASNVTGLFCDYRQLHKLSDEQCRETCEVVRYVKTVEESKALNERKGPMVIISASGMATGGRILHHLKAFAPDPKNHILLAGFQAAGTRGRQIQDGAKEIKIFREFIPVRAQVDVLENMSAHADYTEIIQWLDKSNIHPKRVFITHGEPEAAESLKGHLSNRFGWSCEVPKHDQAYDLGGT